ncbi:MAG: S-layer homology domain-containing protein [Clostridia bacterium]|nr:S-layer homology domain-containing protein [Clostridia bacterium]
MRRRYIIMLFAMLVCLILLPQRGYASFEGDSGALCMDSQYFKDRGFDSASAMLSQAKDRTSESYILVFYSRYDDASRRLLPQIKQWAESNHVLIYGIDQYNKYTPEYGYFNTKTAFEGWEEYLDKNNFSFPAVFAYNADTRKLTVTDNMYNFNVFYNTLTSCGLLGEPYHDYASAGLSSNQLGQLGLMQGTGSGFDLLRAPNRIEALTMLIRLLGKEEEALISDLDHPFADVPRWASPYVGYAYYYGITQGISADMFGSYDTVTAEQYLTLMLRALGYQSGEGGDFAWDNPYALAYSVGILPDGVNTGEFLRADMAIVSRAALDCTLKGEKTALTYKLLAQRALTSADVREFLQLDMSAPTARAELETYSWTPMVNVEMRSPTYVAEAINAAAYMHPTVIMLNAPEGRAFNWAIYLMDKLHFPSGLATDYTLLVSGNTVYILPEYTAAAGIYAALTVDGYTPSATESIAAQFVKNNLTDIIELGAQSFCDRLFEQVEIVESSQTEYSDADAALLINRCTEQALDKTYWLIEEVERSLSKIK